MIRNYLKTARRSLAANKGYSLINVVGLATGMAVALIIGLWAYNQYSYDKFLPDSDRLYQVQRNFNSNGDTLTFKTTALPLATALRTEIPEIEYVAESDWMGPHVLTTGDKKLYMNGAMIGSDFLRMFQYPLLKGDAASVLKDPYSIVLTRSTAQALFGKEDPVNKTVRFDNKNDLKVTGVLADIPANSSLQFNYLVPFSYYEQTEEWVKNARTGSFTGNAFQQFVKLKPGVSYAQVAPKIKDITKREKGNSNTMNSDVILTPLSEWHLYTYENGKNEGGFIEYVRMFSIIGVLVLLIACINFVNLTTARSEKRAKEVGVRKAIGSGRRDLVLRFLAESFLLTLFSFAGALILVQLVLPAFNALTQTKIRIPYENPLFWLVTVGCVLVTALLAGSRPAFYLSSFQPVKVLKGTFHAGRAAALSRKILVVIQFSCSVALIISTIIIYRQVQHAKDRPTGYSVDRLIKTDVNGDIGKNFIALRNELLQDGIIENMTMSSSPATDVYWHSDVESWPGKNAGETIEMGTIVVSRDYFKTMGFSFAAGSDFSIGGDSLSVIFNEAAIRQMRLKDPLQQDITWQGRQLRIRGVVKDALVLSPFTMAQPAMFLYEESEQSNLLYRLSPAVSTQKALSRLTAVFTKYNPAYPFTYEFADQAYASKFNLELLVGKLAGIFAALAVLISCLGLFGLAAYITEQRTREIGIRKVMGATISQVWMLLSKDFILLVGISCVLASPIAFYFLQGWLQKYPYRISIGPFVFIAAAAMAIVITIATVSFQAIKAAIANPVKSLRTE